MASSADTLVKLPPPQEWGDAATMAHQSPRCL